MRRANQYVGKNGKTPKKNTWHTGKQNLGLSHVASAGLEPTPDTDVK